MIDERDLRMDWFSDGRGFQPPLRITHVPTGIIVVSEKFPSRHACKKDALAKLEKALENIT